MRPYGSLCVFIGPCVSLWVLINFYASFYVLMGSYRSLCVLMDFSGRYVCDLVDFNVFL